MTTSPSPRKWQDNEALPLSWWVGEHPKLNRRAGWKALAKIYTKGERVLRIEAMAHNARDLGCRLGVSYFPEAVQALRQMVDRFVEVLDCLDTTFIDAGLLDRLPRPGRLGAVRVGGIDIQHRPQAPCQQRPGPTLRRCSSRDAKPPRHRRDRGLSHILNIFTMVSPQAA